MAIQNPAGPRPGGTASALAISVPTVIKASAGTFWDVNIINIGQVPGYFYDANALPLLPNQVAVPGVVYASGGNIIGALTPPSNIASAGGSPGVSPTVATPMDIAGLGPVPFFNGLVFIPGNDGMVCSVFYA